MTGHPSERLAKYVMGLYGPPSFAQRDQSARAAWDAIVEKCRTTRNEMLDGVRWALKPCGKRLKLTLDDDPVIAIEQIRIATSDKKLSEFSFRLRQELYFLASAIDRFNTKWAKYLQTVDLRHLNTLRDEFNQNYVIEKECATGSELIARQGFVPVASADYEILSQELPPMKPMPRFLRVAWSSAAETWWSGSWTAMMLINVTMYLLVYAPSFYDPKFAPNDFSNRFMAIFYLWVAFIVLFVTLLINQRKRRDLEDELDRLNR